MTPFENGFSYGEYIRYICDRMASGQFGTSQVISWLVFAFCTVCWWFILKKAGEKGWKALIPIYGSYVKYRIAHCVYLFWWMIGSFAAFATAVFGLVPLAFALSSGDLAIAAIVIMIISVLAGLVISFLTWVRLARAFGRSKAFAVGLLLLNPVFVGILAFGKAEYRTEPISRKQRRREARQREPQ
ncbi:MAG: hypothetical protein IKP40_12550 [Clostridia bacterium]|nr:hypothetical protein [Clostridia bacterium]